MRSIHAYALWMWKMHVGTDNQSTDSENNITTFERKFTVTIHPPLCSGSFSNLVF